ncbi:putative membrane protein [Orenia metallireducens]|uniref:Putative membrane protein n=1 Tax=Orenia metallireducens TaxID=1413210 RepID=A0A285HCY3_9FIRM|nr:SHOCT domain-containing protein [Orenia metallireducens]PRX27692.1 putative membrane protein [Orenia metallireducens]SNY33443.1 putative membrane protein [Orenia metallireducens]
MMHGWGHGMGGFFGGGIWMMGLFWIAIIAVGVYLIRNSNNSNNRTERIEGKSVEDPMEIARQRYAKGEISKEEFQEIKDELLK